MNTRIVSNQVYSKYKEKFTVSSTSSFLFGWIIPEAIREWRETTVFLTPFPQLHLGVIFIPKNQSVYWCVKLMKNGKNISIFLSRLWLATKKAYFLWILSVKSCWKWSVLGESLYHKNALNIFIPLKKRSKNISPKANGIGYNHMKEPKYQDRSFHCFSDSFQQELWERKTSQGGGSTPSSSFC